jgi:DNA repair protein RAD7
MITQSPRFNLECLQALIETSKDTLTQLRLKEVGQMSDEFLEELRTLKGRLTYLDISDPSNPCSDEAVISLLSDVGSALSTLDLSGHITLTDKVLEEGILVHCTSIETLGLRELPELTDKGMENFFSSWQNSPLVSIDVSRNEMLATGTVRSILNHSGERLEVLNINGLKDAESEALKDIGEKAPRLKKIDVGFCRQVDDFVMKDIIEKSAGQLTEMKVWGCNRVEGKWKEFTGGRNRVRIHGIECM